MAVERVRKTDDRSAERLHESAERPADEWLRERPAGEWLRERLAGRLHEPDIRVLCERIHADRLLREELYEACFAPDNRLGANALWVFTHATAEDRQWLGGRRDALIDRVLAETDTTRRRLLLTLLERMPYRAAELRGDFIDFCLQTICRPDEPAGIRSLCIKLAYVQCRHYAALCGELSAALDVIGDLPLSPAVVSVRRRIRRQMERDARRLERL